MRKASFIVVLHILSAVCCMAQPREGKRFSPEDFEARLEMFITDKAGFTKSEAKAYYSIYHEMKDKQRRLQNKMFEIKKELSHNASNEECADAIMEITKLNKQKAQLEETYYKKLCKAVPARKVFKAMQAEDRFHRQMLDRMHHKKK